MLKRYNGFVISNFLFMAFISIRDSIDYENPTPDQMKTRIMGSLKEGSIMLFHSGAKNTPEALPGIIAEIKARGYEIVPVSKLIHPEPYTIDFEGRQHKAQ